jgi:hypothetical protein
MPILKNPRHERFAQLRASGKSGSDAYRTIMGRDAKNADVHAAQLTSQPGVRERATSTDFSPRIPKQFPVRRCDNASGHDLADMRGALRTITADALYLKCNDRRTDSGTEAA